MPQQDSKLVTKAFSDEEKPTAFTKSLDIWYADGSVVLVAEKTAFRVHTGILAEYSDIFKDMASLPQPKDGNQSEMYEGCPVLQLQDSATDMRHFLKSIYHFPYFQASSKVKFEVAAAVLRLSHKYLAQSLRQRAIALFASAYPTSVPDIGRNDGERKVTTVDGELDALMVLSVQTDVRVFLPGVFYAASQRPLDEMLQRIYALPLPDAARQDICIKYVLGREKLRETKIREILSFFQPTFQRPNCQTSNDAHTLLNYSRTALLRMTDAEPFEEWCIKNSQSIGSTIGVCQNCTNTIKQHVEKALGDIWERLPGMFGLPGWEVLREELNEDE